MLLEVDGQLHHLVHGLAVVERAREHGVRLGQELHLLADPLSSLQRLLLRGEQHEPFLLDALAFGDVPDERGEHGLAVALDARDRQLDRELPALLVHAGELHAAAQDRGPARLEVPGERRPVPLAQVLRDDQLGDVASERLLARVAERPLRGRVELPDDPPAVDDDHGVQRRADDGGLQGPGVDEDLVHGRPRSGLPPRP